MYVITGIDVGFAVITQYKNYIIITKYFIKHIEYLVNIYSLKHMVYIQHKTNTLFKINSVCGAVKKVWNKIHVIYSC